MQLPKLLLRATIIDDHWRCSPATSALRGLETLKIIERLHEWMHRSRRGKRAVWPPFLVRLLAIRPESLAHRVGCDIKRLHLVDTVQVHAPLHEEVLPPCLHASVFFPTFPIQSRHAIVKVCKESAEALVADDLQVPEEAPM